MKRIGLMSDTHSYLDSKVFEYFKDCDEIWHAGDIGTLELATQLADFKPFRAVWGNIDENTEVQYAFTEDLRFEIEGLDVFMTHIGGYPGRYDARVKKILETNPPKLFICGHSHILKVIADKKLGLLHINPGACGNYGWHKIKTLVRFSVAEGKIFDAEVIEIGNN